MKINRPAWKSTLVATLVLAGCATPPPPLSRGHLAAEPGPMPALAQAANDAANIPALSAGAPRLPAPRPVKPQETYSIVVSNVSVQTLLFALARDAKLNLDIHPRITGNVTLNALDQTIYELLDRIARQIDMRYEVEGQSLFVLPDSPFLRLYKVDYPNITRNSLSNTTSAGDSSSASISNTSNNQFWVTLTQNLKDLLKETDKVIETPAAATAKAAAAAAATAPAGTATQAALTPAAAPALFSEAASVIANPETGVISVRATGKQHARVREFLDLVVGNARRQVLIEATIVEVALTSAYEQGINWSVIRNAVSRQNSAGSNAALSLAQGTFGLALNLVGRTDFSVTLRLLESFGKTRVLSSPKVSVMNNQTALLKVVDEKVYFLLRATPATTDSRGNTTPASYAATKEIAMVGFSMNVTAQVGDDEEITLNLRPSVSRITSYVNDPSPELARVGVTNRVPEIQKREFESIMKVRDGETAVLGGLMQDEQGSATDEVPGAGSVPFFGELFKSRNNKSTKTELVIFLRPTILRDSSINGGASFIRNQLSIDTPVPVGRRP